MTASDRAGTWVSIGCENRHNGRQNDVRNQNTEIHASRQNAAFKGTTAILGLPWLESLGGFAHAVDAKAEPRRLILINVPLGLYRDALMPREAGARYAASEYLSVLN